MAFGEMELAAAILDIVPHMDAEVVTIRIIMQKLAEHFGVDFDTMRAQKATIKRLVMNSYGAERQHESGAEKENHEHQTHEQQKPKPQRPQVRGGGAAASRKLARKSHVISDESDDDNDASGSEHDGDGEAIDEDDAANKSSSQASGSDSDRPRKRTKRSSNATPAKRRAPPASSREKASKSKTSAAAPAKKPRTSTDAPGLTALKEMARAACLLSPRVYASLKKLESEHEQEEHLRELLRAGSVSFSGRYPQKREIESVRRKKQLEKDLEGIDTSLIIEDTSSRPRRAARSAAISYTDQLYNRPGPDENEDEDEAEETGDDVVAMKGEDGAVDASKRRAGAGRKQCADESEEDEEEEEDDDDDAFEANDSDSSEAEF